MAINETTLLSCGYEPQLLNWSFEFQNEKDEEDVLRKFSKLFGDEEATEMQLFVPVNIIGTIIGDNTGKQEREKVTFKRLLSFEKVMDYRFIVTEIFKLKDTEGNVVYINKKGMDYPVSRTFHRLGIATDSSILTEKQLERLHHIYI